MKKQIKKCHYRLSRFWLEAVSLEIQPKKLKGNSMQNVRYKVKVWRWRNKLENAIRGCWMFHWRLWAMKFSWKRWRETACEMSNTTWKYEDQETNYKMQLEAVECFIGGCEPWNSAENVEGKQHAKCQIWSENIKMEKQIKKCDYRLLNFSLEAVSHEIQSKTLKWNSMRNVKHKVKVWRWGNK